MASTGIPGEEVSIGFVAKENKYVSSVLCFDKSITIGSFSYSSYTLMVPDADITFTIEVKNNVVIKIAETESVTEVVISSDYLGKNVVTSIAPEKSIYIHCTFTAENKKIKRLNWRRVI